MTKDQITKQLDEAGIEYDGRWGADRLKTLLPEYKPAPKTGEVGFVVIGPNIWVRDPSVETGAVKLLKGHKGVMSEDAAQDILARYPDDPKIVLI